MKTLFVILLFSLTAMSETVISPNMNLPVPVVGTTPGPDWANDINSCMGSIDQHDHTPGKGVPISSAALSINSDLPLNNNSLTSAKSIGFTSQASLATVQSLYVEAPDLFYNDGNGNVVRITQSGSVAGATGTITGLPSGTASASYQSGPGTFQFQSATNTPANGTFASITIAQQTTTPNGITLKSPNSLASAYNVTFPTSVPAFTSLLTMSTSGVLATVPYHAPTQQTFTSSSGTYTTPTSPGPTYIRVRLVGAGGGGGASADAAHCDAAAGGTGGDTTFSTLTAHGGTGGGSCNSTYNGAGGLGGSATIGAGAFGSSWTGGGGGSGSNTSTAGTSSGAGASSIFGGSGNAPNPIATANGGPAANNSGAGGGGATANSNHPGGGGGSGAGIDAIITSPSATYSYSVGASASAAIAGTGGATGGLAGSGYIEVTEFYQ